MRLRNFYLQIHKFLELYLKVETLFIFFMSIEKKLNLKIMSWKVLILIEREKAPNIVQKLILSNY